MAEEGQRKLAAILAADVVGYSRLMADDERATVAALKQARGVFKECIEAHGGRLIDTAGDSVLAEFKSVVEAVHCAVEVQDRLAAANQSVDEARRMRFRIGVNLGDVIEEADGTLYGDGVNIAARLEALAEPGGVMISESAHMQVRNRLDVGFQDAGHHTVKNIPEPVRAYRVAQNGSSTAPPADRAKSRRRLAAIGAATAVVAALVAWQSLTSLEYARNTGSRQASETDPALAMPTRPSIAVLPFDNLSGEPEQDYFVDGLTEEIVAALSRFSHLSVVSRNAMVRSMVDEADGPSIGAALGARYLVRGSVRRSSDTIRVSARLIDAETEEHLWSETFERALTADNVFAVQDDITAKIAATVGDPMGVIARADEIGSKRARPASLDAYDCVLRASAYARSFDENLRVEAQTCLEKSVAADPTDALAWAWLAELYLHDYKRGADPQPGLIDRALDAADRAVRLAPDDSRGYMAQANARYYAGNLDGFVISAERAIDLNPYSPDALVRLGHRFAYAGDWERGLALIDRAADLDPYVGESFNFVRYFYYYDKSEYDQALAAALKINLPDYLWTHAALAAAYGQLGRAAEAERAVARMVALRPDIAKTARADRWKFFRYQEDLLDHFMDGLRKAGLDIQDG